MFVCVVASCMTSVNSTRAWKACGGKFAAWKGLLRLESWLPALLAAVVCLASFVSDRLLRWHYLCMVWLSQSVAEINIWSLCKYLWDKENPWEEDGDFRHLMIKVNKHVIHRWGMLRTTPDCGLAKRMKTEHKSIRSELFLYLQSILNNCVDLILIKVVYKHQRSPLGRSSAKFAIHSNKLLRIMESKLMSLVMIPENCF